jgi:4-amino-4-deoxy-L-arabinose transferase-like glycosyltransferase
MKRDAWTAALVAVVAAALVLRIPGLNSGLWYDEIVTLVTSVRQPIRNIVTLFPGVNQHPLYSVLAHLSIAAFGESAWALRLPACLFGVASIVMVDRLGSVLMTRAEAWSAAALLAASYHHVWFSQDARGYTVLGFLALYSTWLLVRAADRGRPRDFGFYVLAAVAGVYTHLSMLLIVAGQAIVVLCGRPRWWPDGHAPAKRPFVLATVGVVMLSALAYAPFGHSLVAIARANPNAPDAHVANAWWALQTAVRSAIEGADVPAAIAGVLLGAVGFVSLWRRQPAACLLLLAPGVVTAIAIVLSGQPVRPRFFFFLSGAAAIGLARGIGVLAEITTRAGRQVLDRWRTPAVVVTTLVFCATSAPALSRDYRYPKQDFDGAVRFLDEAEASGARITAASAACRPFEIYYGRTWTCLQSAVDLDAAITGSRRVLTAFTLAEYIRDASLKDRLDRCPVIHRFIGTLGNGDIIACELSR